MKENPFTEVSEKRIVKNILKMLRKEYPGTWYKIHGGPWQEAGIPDIIGCHERRFFAFEVKRPDKRSRVTAQQKYQLNRLKTAGAWTAVVTSVEETREALVQFYKRKV